MELTPGTRVKDADGDSRGTLTGVTVQSTGGTLHIIQADDGLLDFAFEGDIRDTFEEDESEAPARDDLGDEEEN